MNRCEQRHNSHNSRRFCAFLGKGYNFGFCRGGLQRPPSSWKSLPGPPLGGPNFSKGAAARRGRRRRAARARSGHAETGGAVQLVGWSRLTLHGRGTSRAMWRRPYTSTEHAERCHQEQPPRGRLVRHGCEQGSQRKLRRSAGVTWLKLITAFLTRKCAPRATNRKNLPLRGPPDRHPLPERTFPSALCRGRHPVVVVRIRLVDTSTVVGIQEGPLKTCR